MRRMGLVSAGTACDAPTKPIDAALHGPPDLPEPNYLIVITRLDGEAGASCADGATATAE
jgi:hypothetical protein